MTTPRTQGIRSTLLSGLLCLVMAAPAVAEKKAGSPEMPAGATDPSPWGVELGVGDGRLESFARALHGLASGITGTVQFSGSQFHSTYTGKTDQVVCGFKVTGSIERFDSRPHYTQPVRDPDDDTKIVKPSIQTEYVQKDTLNIQIEVPPESLDASEKEKKSFLLKFTIEESTHGKKKPKDSAARNKENPDTSLHFEVKSENFGMDALIDHAKKNGCAIQEEWKGGQAHTLIRVLEAGE
jgi:hypothetical protein